MLRETKKELLVTFLRRCYHKMRIQRQKKFTSSIIGAGAVGTAVGKALHQKGHKILSVISRSLSSAKSCAKEVGSKVASTHLEDISSDSQLIFITTPDSVISSVVQQLVLFSEFDFPRMCVVHTSGALTSDVLEPLRSKRSAVLSLHPIQSFPREEKASQLAQRLHGIYYGIEGNTDGITIGKNIVRELDGKSVILSKDSKVLYHVACVFASNYLVSSFGVLSEIFEKLQLDKANFLEVFRPLIESTIQNVHRTTPMKALTGPIARGELETLLLHLKELKVKLPHLIPLYIVMGMETIRLALQKGSISGEQASKMLDQMTEYIRKDSAVDILLSSPELRN